MSKLFAYLHLSNIFRWDMLLLWCAGGYVLEKRKLPEYIVPDLDGFKLKPYVSYDTPKS